MRRTVIWVAFAALIGLIVLSIFILHRQSNMVSVPEVTVTIPEGYTVADINNKLNEVGVLDGQDLPAGVEGYLFPDTYEFFVSSSPNVVLQKFISNFNLKATPLFSESTNIQQTLIIASLIEHEIKPAPTGTPYAKSDRAIVSGIIEKRLANNMPLQIDATLCYIKPAPCLPLTPQDMKIDSPYNTYIHTGLPPTPIDNPGADAIYAALHPAISPYWFFLSDPKTGATIFSSTLDQQTKNIVKYLQ